MICPNGCIAPVTPSEFPVDAYGPDGMPLYHLAHAQFQHCTHCGASWYDSAALAQLAQQLMKGNEAIPREAWDV